MVPIMIEYSWIEGEDGIKIYRKEMPSNKVISMLPNR